MLITTNVEITFNPNTVNHYRSFGYQLNKGDKITIDIKHLLKGSNLYVNVKCDVCEKELNVMYKVYASQITTHNLFSCSQKCSNTKRQKTNLDRYGTTHYVNPEKTKETKLERHGMSGFNNQDKIKKTNLDRYGVENTFQSNEKKTKIKKTLIEKYGVDTPLLSKELLEKSKQTKLKRYGDENYNNIEKARQTFFDLNGYYNQFQSILFKNGMIEKYGVEHPMQVTEIFQKALLSGLRLKKHDLSGLRYQGNNEKDFLDKYYDKLKITKINIKYEIDNIEHTYYPDFYIEEYKLIIEIKSSFWFKKHLTLNKIKESASIKQGYKFLFIIDCNYTEFNNIIYGTH